MAEPNDDAASVDILEKDYGAEPAGVDDVRILVPEPLLAKRRGEFPGLDVHPLVVSTGELTLADWKLLMGVEGGDQLYVKAMTTMFRRLRDNISLPSLREALDESTLSTASKAIAETRIRFVEEFAADEGGAADHIAPGRLLIVDVRDPLMEESDVLALFMVLLRLFSQARDRDGRAFNKLIVFDEAHKYMDNARLTGAIVETVREMRHVGTSVVIASQNPPSVPRDVVELCTVLVAHKFTSPQWLEHVRKVNEAFGRDLAPPQLAALSSGEAYVWSRDGAPELRRPQRVRMRPRLSRHGGGTRRAGDD
jgi:DNA helicase HerA-like ATPase